MINTVAILELVFVFSDGYPDVYKSILRDIWNKAFFRIGLVIIKR
jgi:hypothetical protein